MVETRAAGLGRLGFQAAWIAATVIAHHAELLTLDADVEAVRAVASSVEQQPHGWDSLSGRPECFCAPIGR